MRGNPQALFGKRPTEKDPAKGTSLAVHFTLWGPGAEMPRATRPKGIPGGYGGGPGVLVSVRVDVDDGDGAGCVEEQGLADGAEHHSVNAATTAAAHSEQLRVLSGIKEGGAR